jgi:hypothetical protein
VAQFQDEVASEKVTRNRLFAFEIFYRSKVSDLRISVRYYGGPEGL